MVERLGLVLDDGSAVGRKRVLTALWRDGDEETKQWAVTTARLPPRRYGPCPPSHLRGAVAQGLLTRASLDQWRPTIDRNLQRQRTGATGEPHASNVERWASLVDRGDVNGLHRVLTGLGRDMIQMREVSPMGGLLSQAERTDVLAGAR
ncbi:MAG: hypothetical protein FWH11_04545 [Micrococcales bacterium]|nr:hypothetical protein [Micrococcales bacterium]